MSGKTPRKTRKTPAQRAQAKETVPDESGKSQEESPEIVVVLPHTKGLPRTKGGKHGRVKEINPGSDKPAARPFGIVAGVPSDKADGEPKDVLRKRRRFLRGERSDWGGKEGRRSLKWMLLTALGVAVLVVLAVVLDQLHKNNRARNIEQSPYSKLTPANDDILGNIKDTDNLDQLLNSRSQAESIFAAYACAKSPDDFIDLVHAPTQNRELIGSEWKPLGMKPGWVPGGDSVWSVKNGIGTRFAVLEGDLGDFTVFKAYFREDEGKLKMDWKATSGYCSADFADLKSGKGDGSEVRVWLSEVDFYTSSFPEGKYRSFRVKSPLGDTTIWGYAPAGSDLEKDLLKLIQQVHITGESQSEITGESQGEIAIESQGEIQVILSLEPSDGDSLPDQCLIADIMRLDWLGE